MTYRPEMDPRIKRRGSGGTGNLVHVSFGSGTAATGDPLGLGEGDSLGASDATLDWLGDGEEVAC